jgi:hypothetical protein
MRPRGMRPVDPPHPRPRVHAAAFLAAAITCALTPSNAGAQPAAPGSAEPIRITFKAPEGCPSESVFAGEIQARTARARLAAQDEKARTFHVVIEKKKKQRHGTLRIEDTSGGTDVREISAEKCSEVVSALALIAALAIDPQASTAPGIAPKSTLPGALPPDISTRPALESAIPIRVKMPWYAGLGANPGMPRFRLPSLDGGDGLPPPLPVMPVVEAPIERHTRVTFGAHILAMGAVTPDLAPTLAPFVDVHLEQPGFFTPSLRLSLQATEVMHVSAPQNGDATFQWTAMRLEGCPTRWAIAQDFAFVPCVGAAGGVLYARGQGRDPVGGGVTTDATAVRPWLDFSAVGRGSYLLFGALAVEAQAGIVIPVTRDSFLLVPSDIVHAVPSVGGFFGAGIALRIP